MEEQIYRGKSDERYYYLISNPWGIDNMGLGGHLSPKPSFLSLLVGGRYLFSYEFSSDIDVRYELSLSQILDLRSTEAMNHCSQLTNQQEGIFSFREGMLIGIGGLFGTELYTIF